MALTLRNAGVLGGVLVQDIGALGGIRTPNLLIRSQMLYPLSYERRLRCVRRQALGWPGRDAKSESSVRTRAA